MQYFVFSQFLLLCEEVAEYGHEFVRTGKTWFKRF